MNSNVVFTNITFGIMNITYANGSLVAGSSEGSKFAINGLFVNNKQEFTLDGYPVFNILVLNATNDYYQYVCINKTTMVSELSDIPEGFSRFIMKYTNGQFFINVEGTNIYLLPQTNSPSPVVGKDIKDQGILTSGYTFYWESKDISSSIINQFVNDKETGWGSVIPKELLIGLYIFYVVLGLILLVGLVFLIKWIFGKFK